MMKEHKKLYKSGKNWMVATLTTVAVAGGMALAGTNVHADATTPVQSEGTIQAPAQTTQNTELANAQSDAQQQQQTINDQSAKLDEQNQQLSDAQGQQSSAQQALDQAKQAQQEATANDPDVQQAQQQVNNQQVIVDEAQQTVNTDQQGVQNAQNAYDQAKQTATDAINQSADQQKQEAQSTVDNLESQGKSTQTANLDSQINNVSGQVTDAQNDVNNTNSQISSLQNQVQDLQNDQGNTQGFDGFHYPEEAGQPGTRTNLTSYDKQYTYVSNPADEQVQIDDYTNLSPEIQKELTIYAAQLVNSFGKEVWEATGINNFEPFMINDASLNEAKEAAQLYSQDNWSIMGHGAHHDENALEQAALDNGAFAYEMDRSRTPAVNESATGQILATGSRSTTLDKLKNAIFNAINNMLYDDVENTNGHMMSLAQVWHESDGWHFGHDWVGLAFDKLGQLHIVFARNNAYTIDYSGPIYKATNYNYSPYLSSDEGDDNSAQIASLNSQISNLQNDLASQKSNLQSLQTQLQNLQAQKANVQFDLSQLTPDQQTQYNNAKEALATADNWKADQLANLDNEASVKSAKSTLDSAKNILQRDKDNQVQAQQALATLQQKLDDVETKANAGAEQAVKDAQDKLNKINTKISGLQEAIATTKQNIQNAQDQLAKDNQKIDELKNGQKPSQPDQPAKGGDQGTTTPSQPADGNKGDDTTEPTTPAKPHQPTKGDDQGTTTPTNPTTPAKPDNGNASIAGQAGHKPGKAESSEGITTSESGKSEAVTMTREQYKSQQQANNKTLPQTGNENSAAVVAIGILSAMFGLGLASKSKKEF